MCIYCIYIYRPSFKVYRKNRVADLSGGPGAYLEGTAAAAQIASARADGRRGGDDDSDGDADTLGDVVAKRRDDAVVRPKPAASAADGVGVGSGGVAGGEQQQQPHHPENGKPHAHRVASGAEVALEMAGQAAAAGGGEKGKHVPGMAGAGGGAHSGSQSGLPDALGVPRGGEAATAAVAAGQRGGGGGGEGDEEEEDIDVDVDMDDGDVNPERRMQMERAQQEEREQKERRLAQLDDNGNVNDDDDPAAGGRGRGMGYGDGNRQQHPDSQYDNENVGEDYRGGYGDNGGVDVGEGMEDGHPREGGARPRGESSDVIDSNPGVASLSDEEEEVDWEDSADEDVDAAEAEALEEARIGMARAAARDLRESRATRWVDRLVSVFRFCFMFF